MADILSHNQRTVDTGQSYRMALYLNRILAVSGAVSLLLNIVLALAIYGLLPLKETEVFLVEAKSRSDVVFTVAPVRTDIGAFDLYIESALRRYVNGRERIDHQTEPERWKEVQFSSGGEVWKQFLSVMIPDGGKGAYDAMKERGMTRDIEIKRVDEIERARRYQVTFERADRTLDRLDGRELWVATITVDFNPQRVREEDKLTNPMGMFVEAYTLARDVRGEESANE